MLYAPHPHPSPTLPATLSCSQGQAALLIFWQPARICSFLKSNTSFLWCLIEQRKAGGLTVTVFRKPPITTLPSSFSFLPFSLCALDPCHLSPQQELHSYNLPPPVPRIVILSDDSVPSVSNTPLCPSLKQRANLFIQCSLSSCLFLQHQLGFLPSVHQSHSHRGHQ